MTWPQATPSLMSSLPLCFLTLRKFPNHPAHLQENDSDCLGLTAYYLSNKITLGPKFLEVPNFLKSLLKSQGKDTYFLGSHCVPELFIIGNSDVLE